MRAKGARSWVVGGGLGLLLFMVAYALVSVEMRQSGVQGPPRRTTYSAGPWGYKALYLWLRAMGVAAERWERDLRALPPDVRVLLIVEPETGLTKAEMEGVSGWVRDGGTLVLVLLPPNPLLDVFDLKAETGVGPGGVQATVAQPGPYTRAVKTVHSKLPLGLKSERPQGIVYLLGPRGTGLLTVLQEGKGRVIAVADPDLFSNLRLKEASHARLAANLLLTHLGEGRLVVDEYHHGYGRVSSVVAHLGSSRFAAPLLQGMVLLLLLWAAQGRRFGPARPIVEEERRSTMEYVHAMAGLLRKARARGLALEVVVGWVEEEARRALIETDRALQGAFRASRQQAQGPLLDDRQLLITVRRLYRALEGARRRALGT